MHRLRGAVASAIPLPPSGATAGPSGSLAGRPRRAAGRSGGVTGGGRPISARPARQPGMHRGVAVADQRLATGKSRAAFLASASASSLVASDHHAPDQRIAIAQRLQQQRPRLSNRQVAKDRDDFESLFGVAPRRIFGSAHRHQAHSRWVLAGRGALLR